MEVTRQQIAAAAAAIRQRAPNHSPRVGVALGSGLGALADALTESIAIPYADLPHFPRATVSGHHGAWRIGTLAGQTVAVMQGRFHYYEGYSLAQVTMPIRVMQALGIETLLLTNAAGGLHPDWAAGDLMLITDHIALAGMAGHNPLRGANDETQGPRFPDMTIAYDAPLRRLALDVATQQGIPLRQGIYAWVAGPSYETPAEIRFLRAIGADAVGMSTAPEVIVARHAGLRVLAVSVISNIAQARPDAATVTAHEDVLAAGQAAAPRLVALLQGILERL